jgi:hypothetical protein
MEIWDTLFNMTLSLSLSESPGILMKKHRITEIMKNI